MSVLNDAKAVASAANQLVSDLEASPAPTTSAPVEYSSQIVQNADGSVIITLTPSAPVAVSDGAQTSAPAGDVGPGPTGQ